MKRRAMHVESPWVNVKSPLPVKTPGHASISLRPMRWSLRTMLNMVVLSPLTAQPPPSLVQDSAPL